MRINYNDDTVFSAISFTRTLLKLRKDLLKMLADQITTSFFTPLRMIR